MTGCETGVELKAGSLPTWWIDRLSEKMERHFPDVIGSGELVDHWKNDGWNDGTTTLFGVYKVGEAHKLCEFPDYGDASCENVAPVFVHTGWMPAAKRERAGE